MDPAQSAGPVAEYTSLRLEIDTRAKYQQQILALQLTLSSAVFGFALSRPQLLALLLAIPMSSYLLSGRYAAQREAIRSISHYIRDSLHPRTPGGLGWVAWSRQNPRPNRLIDWLIPMLLTFPGAAVLALGWTFALVFYRDGVGVPARIGLIVVWLAGLFGSAVSAWTFVRIYREARPARSSASRP
ncbi:hypothetical protein HH310_29035 [Actinoplanes sp. TBRC 11911]|uniref:hypothetical protein n=1 Tax=Actinoplanes sp. TBRC 11911 TaxID=2729386 RepID=UPI00145D8833|nr:hypothetical protein [Actinoplanes sp. TBRC 11911]NMO55217.1 hypothetical protein [Actinoplanes sp. TBRC 11911]